MNKIKGLIMDWAGTAVDYGCFAPVAAFVDCFKAIGAPVTVGETRAHMGMTKIEEIRALVAIGHVREDFKAKYGRDYGEQDVQECYMRFQASLFAILEEYSMPIPGVVSTVADLKAAGIKVGSTTGYTDKMMDIVIPAAARHGYRTDCCVTSDGLPGGRPKPYMIYQNMCRLDIPSPRQVVKVGDTIADIKEGVNAGTWSVGIIMGSNELALTEDEVNEMPADRLKSMMKDMRMRMYAAGADYVIDTIDELPALIECINKRME